MTVWIYTKNYFKESPEVQKAVLNACNNIIDRIKVYENQGMLFNRVFNDDGLKYDKHGEFFTYKCRANHIQLRVLYTYFKIDDEDIILVYDFVVKSKNDKKYIKQFDRANNASVCTVFNCTKKIA